MPRGKSLVVNPGDRFGDWMVLNEAPPVRRKTGATMRRMRCLCTACDEKVVDVDLGNLRNGHSQRCPSCGAKRAHEKRDHKTSHHPMVLATVQQSLPNLSDQHFQRLLSSVMDEAKRREVAQ